MSLESMWLLLQIILINLVLSGDNAVVIALASRHLPERQKKKAIWLGTSAAVIMRILLTAGAVYVLDIPYIQALGAMLLLYIAFKLLMDEEEGHQVREAVTLGAAVWTIMAADFVMSLDNVLAVAAVAEGNIFMLVIGIAMSIPLIIWGSNIIVNLLSKVPALIYAGAGLLGYTAGEMLLGDEKLSLWFATFHPSIYWVLPTVCVLIVIIGGWIGNRSSAKA